MDEDQMFYDSSSDDSEQEEPEEQEADNANTGIYPDAPF